MKADNSPIPKAPLPTAERQRRKREIIIIIAIVPVVALLTFVENRVIHFGGDVPIPNSTLMFILININLLLLLLLIFLVFRNLVKLLYDRRRKVLGARLRTRLVAAFVTLTLVPTVVLFFFSINFITTSIAFWFSVPVEQALENSLEVARQLYQYTEKSNSFYQERIAYQIQDKKLLDPDQLEELTGYVGVVQRAFNLDAVEIYTPGAVRLTMAQTAIVENSDISTVSADQLKSGMNPSGVRSFSETVASGELFRTIGTIPSGVAPADAMAFVVLTILIPPDLSEKMASISRGFEEYRQIKMLKRPIQITYYITLSIVALLVVFCAVWFGFYLAKTISIPIMELAEGTRRVAEGDLGVTIHMPVDDEIGSLVDAFNRMTRDLRIGREALERSACKLQEQYIEIEKRRQYMEVVLKNVSAGVITLDADGVISTINKSAEKMFSLKSEEILDKSYRDVLR
jgi:two-component system nitrogen regulation sensor histidine kinase NtrY